MNKVDYCSLETSQRLNRLGFDWETDYYYSGFDKELYSRWFPNEFEYNEPQTPAITLAQAAKWMREERYMSVEVYSSLDYDKQWEWRFFIQNLEDYMDRPADATIHCDTYLTYEKALTTGIDKALDLLEKGKSV